MTLWTRILSSFQRLPPTLGLLLLGLGTLAPRDAQASDRDTAEAIVDVMETALRGTENEFRARAGRPPASGLTPWRALIDGERHLLAIRESVGPELAAEYFQALQDLALLRAHLEGEVPSAWAQSFALTLPETSALEGLADKTETLPDGRVALSSATLRSVELAAALFLPSDQNLFRLLKRLTLENLDAQIQDLSALSAPDVRTRVLESLISAAQRGLTAPVPVALQLAALEPAPRLQGFSAWYELNSESDFEARRSAEIQAREDFLVSPAPSTQADSDCEKARWWSRARETVRTEISELRALRDRLKAPTVQDRARELWLSVSVRGWALPLEGGGTWGERLKAALSHATKPDLGPEFELALRKAQSALVAARTEFSNAKTLQDLEPLLKSGQVLGVLATLAPTYADAATDAARAELGPTALDRIRAYASPRIQTAGLLWMGLAVRGWVAKKIGQILLRRNPVGLAVATLFEPLVESLGVALTATWLPDLSLQAYETLVSLPRLETQLARIQNGRWAAAGFAMVRPEALTEVRARIREGRSVLIFQGALFAAAGVATGLKALWVWGRRSQKVFGAVGIPKGLSVADVREDAVAARLLSREGLVAAGFSSSAAERLALPKSVWQPEALRILQAEAPRVLESQEFLESLFQRTRDAVVAEFRAAGREVNNDAVSHAVDTAFREAQGALRGALDRAATRLLERIRDGQTYLIPSPTLEGRAP